MENLIASRRTVPTGLSRMERVIPDASERVSLYYPRTASVVQEVWAQARAARSAS